MIQVISIHQEKEWKQFVSKSENYDFYHTWYYHHLDKSGNPILFVYQENEDFIAFPLIKRVIPNSNLFDLTSVYGYSGPLSNKSFDKICNQMKENFKKEFEVFLKENGYISVFSRLHPFFNQLSLMEMFDGIHDNGLTVVIDLQTTIEVQRSNYQSKLRRHINKTRKLGFYLKEVNTAEAIREFTALYTENMQRLGASESYMFTEEYFQSMLNADDFDAKLFMLYLENEAVCGEIIICTKKIMQSHLLASSDKYNSYSPTKLITDEVSLIGRQLGMHYYSLGGGLGFKQDSLFHFKSLFSKLFMDFKSWRYIANEENYNLLLKESNIDPDLRVDFFPLYRYQSAEKNDLIIENILEN